MHTEKWQRWENVNTEHNKTTTEHTTKMKKNITLSGQVQNSTEKVEKQYPLHTNS